jgi:hypothetical protein
LRLLRSPRLAPDWANSPPQARFLTPARQSRSAPGSPLPFWAFQPLRIDALTRPLIERLTLRMRPIAFRSPPPFLLLVSAAAQRSRLASLPLGLLFLEPLGTKRYVHANARRSQINLSLRWWFSSTLSWTVLLHLRDSAIGFFVDKTSPLSFVTSAQGRVSRAAIKDGTPADQSGAGRPVLRVVVGRQFGIRTLPRCQPPATIAPNALVPARLPGSHDGRVLQPAAGRQ